MTKSQYLAVKFCEKRGWLEQRKRKEEKQSAETKEKLSNGITVGDCAKKYFGDYEEVEWTYKKSEMVDNTLLYINAGVKTIAEATFMANGCYCQADLVRVLDDGSLNVYEVKSSANVKEYHILDMAFQYYTITNAGFKINAFFHMGVDSKYVRVGELNLQELFKVQDFTDRVILEQEGIEAEIQRCAAIKLGEEEPEVPIGMHCKNPVECPFFEYCTKHLPENNVFTIAGLTFKKKFALYERGIITFEDIKSRKPKEVDKGKLNQVMSTLEDREPVISQLDMEEFLVFLPERIYFLDFETFQQVIPEWDYVKPYSQIPFQYSLHYRKNAKGKLWHKEFLAQEGTDPRKALARRLCKDIPKDACVLAYNMSFEKGVIKNLASLYSDLSEHLMCIHDNMEDLMIPFKNQWYYQSNFNGSYSIKAVLPGLFPDDPELDYHNLGQIQNGSAAMEVFASLHLEKDKDKVAEIRKDLLAYCKLDTYAMVKVLDYLNSLIWNQKHK